MTQRQITSATVNIPNKTRKKNRRKAVEKAAKRGEIFGLNEILSRANKAQIKEIALDMGLGHYGIQGSPNPIFWDKSKWKKKHGSIKVIHGKAPRSRLSILKPGFNAERYRTTVILEPRDGVGPDVTFMNVHWAPNAWVDKVWRAQMIRRSIRDTQQAIRAHTKRGRVAYLSGDLNEPGRPDIKGVDEWLAVVNVDKQAIALPNGWKLALGIGSGFPAPIDHKRGARSTAVIMQK